MSLERISGLFFLALAGAVGCSAYRTLNNVPIDCTADNGYDIQYVYTFDTVTSTMFYGSGDHPDADVPNPPVVEALTDGGARCDSTTALLLHTFHNNDWGSVFGIYSFGPRDESAYQGLSFWARAPGNTTKGFTLSLDDTNTFNPIPAMCGVDAGTTAPPVDSGTLVCKNYCTPDGGASLATPYTDPLTGLPAGGGTTSAPPADACGNAYQVVTQVTTGWQFYTFPFSEFRQLAEPNMVGALNTVFTNKGSVPGTGLLTSALMGLTFRMPPEADTNIWLSHLGFYRKKTGGDGGVDAGQDVRGQ